MGVSTGERRLSFLKRRLRDPFVVLAIAVYAAALIGLSRVPGADWRSAVALLVGLVLACGVAWLLLRGYEPPTQSPVRPGMEASVAVGYAAFILALAGVTVAGGSDLISGSTGWLFFVFIPATAVVYARLGRSRLIDTVRSMGFTFRGLKRGLAVAVAVSAVLLPFLLLAAPASHRADMLAVLLDPSRFAVAFPLGFAVALALIALPEEAFFRGILQSRLEGVLRSPVRALLVASFLFGLAHLPYAYFASAWPTHGNLAWSLGRFVTVQASSGVLLGFLWLRTRSLAAPAIVHAFIDATAFMTRY